MVVRRTIHKAARVFEIRKRVYLLPHYREPFTV